MRNKINSFKTFSNLHTKFGITNPRFKKSFKPESIVVLFNSPILAKINDLSANLFNKKDILLKVDMVDIDFEKLTDDKGAKIINNSKSIIGYIFHKNAYFNGFSIKDFQQTIKLPKFKLLFETLNTFGFGRLPQFPIIQYLGK